MPYPPLMTASGCVAEDFKSAGGMNDPAAFPQEEASVLFFGSLKHNLCSCFCPPMSLLPSFPSTGLAPAASHSHLQISFTRHPIHPRPVSRQEGQESGAYTSSSSSSSFLPSLQMGFCEGLSQLFPWGGNLVC